VNIKINETSWGWSLWVTENPGETQAPIFTAKGRTKEQILAVLPIILDQQTVKPARQDDDERAATAALTTMLTILDSWIEGARANHEAMAHRGENRGDECWRNFAPSDIRRMVNDAATDLGVTPFPLPEKPLEDR
jgi:hypothetical protein